MNIPLNSNLKSDAVTGEKAELELSDEDILDAMQHIPGYLDISTEDFRTIYHLAHRHSLGRLFGNFRVKNLMRKGIEPLKPDMYLDHAAKILVRSGLKSLPVVDQQGGVVGMLTETDFLRQFNVNTFLELLLGNNFEFKHRVHEIYVGAAMTSPVVTIGIDADFRAVISAFRIHDGRSTPVIDSNGGLLGMLLRKDFIAALNMGNTR